jgi:hypothetical protein
MASSPELIGRGKRVCGFKHFVITDLVEYEKNHEDLRAFLEENCMLITEARSYLIFDRTCAIPTA